MGANTKIQWSHHTFNPWRGCVKVAAGCVNCYAESQSKRNPKTLGVWGPNGTRVVASEAMWREPFKWNRDGCPQCKGQGVVSDWIGSVAGDLEQSAKDCPACEGREYRPRVFCASLADAFEDWEGECHDHTGAAHYTRDGDPTVMLRNKQLAGFDTQGYHYTTLDDCRARLFRLIDMTPQLDWLLLTKRPENVRRMWPVAYSDDAGDCEQEEERRFFAQGDVLSRKRNVWLGTSIACQEDAHRNIPELLKCRDLAAKLFLSIEPLVGPVMLHHWIDRDGMFHHAQGVDADWVIVGGESGRNARPCDIAWIRSIVRQCQEAGVPVFVKQLGARPTEYVVTAIGQDAYGNVDDDGRYEVMNLRDPKGGDPAEWPEDVSVREVPS